MARFFKNYSFLCRLWPMLFGLVGVAWGQGVKDRLQLEIQHVGTETTDAAGNKLSRSRLEYLVSGLALKKADGSWMESRDWFGHVNAAAGVTRLDADGIGPGDFTGIRFFVGLDAATNALDPAKIPPEHPLYSAIQPLHWGWQGGFIFLALEGHWRSPGSEEPLGFSYHLAATGNAVLVELPVNFKGGQPNTIVLEVDAWKILHGPEAISLTPENCSTHSREGDPVLPKLKQNLAKAFQVKEVRRDVFQAVTQAVVTTVPLGDPYVLRLSDRLPKAKLPADNPLTVEGVALGKRLFSENLLSINNRQSCASCHEQRLAFGSADKLSLGAEGQLGKRHAMPLFNLAWGEKFFWDGRAASLRQQVLQPIQDPHEMNEKLDRAVAKLAAHPEYPAAFSRAFGSAEVTEERLAKALEQFLLTLVSQDSKFDQAAKGLATLTAEERRGLTLFTTEHDPARNLRGADCFHCHGGNLFTSNQFANNGLDATFADLGLGAVTGKAEDAGKFKVPSLRNIALTAPYMHDGRFATLEEVIDHYDHGVKRSATLDPNLAKHPEAGLGLSAADKRALIAFLKTLTDETLINPSVSQR